MSVHSLLLKNTVVKAVGVSFYADVVANICEGDQIQLIPEPTNSYDPNAVCVVTAFSLDGKTVGFRFSVDRVLGFNSF